MMEVEALTGRVAALLSSAKAAVDADERAGGLVEKLPALDDSPVRIALAGPFNAGKTMLIGAFLKLSKLQIDELTAATPKTSGVTPYTWEDCIFLDLPGTLSGLDDHDLEAAAGIRRADLLVLVTSVELPGSAETEQIIKLLAEEGFAHRCIVVVNKSQAEESDPEVVRAEMKARIDDYPHIQILFTDARDYLDSLNFPDLEDDERELLRDDSGILVVEDALRVLVSDQAALARLHAACHEVGRVCVDASRLWEADEDEQSLELTADRITLAFAIARADLTDATDVALSTLQGQITGVGTTLAVAVSEEDGSLSENSASDAGQRENTAMQRYEDEVSKAVDAAVTRLVEQVGAASQEWDRYTTTNRKDTLESPGHFKKRTSAKRDELVDRAIDAGVSRVKRHLEEFAKGGVTAGSPAHNLARKINGLLRITPKPYTHVKTATKITKFGQGANTAFGFIAPVVDLKGIWDNVTRTNAIQKQREHIRATYSEHAETVVAEERQALDAYIEEVLSPIRGTVHETLSDAAEGSSARLNAQAGFADVGTRARELAAVIDENLARVGPSPNEQRSVGSA